LLWPEPGFVTDQPTATDAADVEDPTVVSVVGPSGAGKTTLVEDLVAAFEDRRVATIKSIHHDIEPDTAGTDTHRHRTAGADTAVGITPELTFEVSRGGKGSDRTDSDAELAALRRTLDRLTARGFDLVLVEGFSAAPLPTIHAGERDEIDPNRIGTGEDSLETLRRAIEAADPIDPESLSGR
jgi:molybdopterin-guanine dinucleotide biosynthesis protein B